MTLSLARPHHAAVWPGLGGRVRSPLVVLTLSCRLAALVWRLCGSPAPLPIPSVTSERSVFSIWKRDHVLAQTLDLVDPFLFRAVVIVTRATWKVFVFHLCSSVCPVNVIVSTTAGLARGSPRNHTPSSFSCRVSERPFQTCLH